MNLYIKADMEGVTGVVNYEQVIPERAEYKFGQQMLMSDLSALLKGIYAHGAHNVLIYDMHFYGRNVDLEKIDSRAKVICGKPPLTENFCYGMEQGFDGLILSGFHSMAENKKGLLHHSYEDDTESISINGKLVGEIGLEVALAGEMDIPLIFVSGDSEGVKEAREILGDVSAVVVKESKSESGALCYPPEETSRRIKETIPLALDRLLQKKLSPYRFSPPVTLKVCLSKESVLKMIKKKFPEKISGKNILSFKGNSVRQVWQEYRDLYRGVDERKHSSLLKIRN